MDIPEEIHPPKKNTTSAMEDTNSESKDSRKSAWLRNGWR